MNSSMFLVVFVGSVFGLVVLARQIPSIVNGETQSRVVGGYSISIEDAPWTVAVLYFGRATCGGSIVSITKMLSAAHCSAGRDPKSFSVRAGSSEAINGGQLREISKIIEHPQYSHVTAVNDISILFLATQLILSSRVAVINIDKRASALPSGVEVFTTGWGQSSKDSSDEPGTLRAVSIPIIGNDRCSKLHGNEIISSMMCAGLEIGGKGSCFGDSGGPLTLNNTLIGIVSFGGETCFELPTVYTRVSSYQDWIEEHLIYFV